MKRFSFAAASRASPTKRFGKKALKKTAKKEATG